MATVTCSECGHDAEISAPSDVWRCNCAAGVGPEDCGCAAVNEADVPVEHNPPDRSAEVAALEVRLAVLRGQAAAEGEVRGG